MKTGVIDVGGGLRGIYAAGVLDRCIDDEIHFDLAIGISAGSANIASYMAGQRGRNYRFYTQYTFRKEYMSLRNYVSDHSYIGLDYVYSKLSNSDGEDPLDFKAVAANPGDLIVIACDSETGETKYFTKADLAQDQYDIFKASCAIPFVCPPYPVGDRSYFDGALGDTIPVEKAFAEGCDKVVLILTKPKDVIRSPKKDIVLARQIEKQYPAAARRLANRAKRYNKGVAIAKEYEREGRLLIVAPDDTCGVDTLRKDKDALRALYGKGLRDGAQIQEFLFQ